MNNFHSTQSLNDLIIGFSIGHIKIEGKHFTLYLSYFKHFLNFKKVGSNSGTMIENTIEITVFNCLASFH